jgi:hypothetical protein
MRRRHWARYVLSVSGVAAAEMDRHLVKAAGFSKRAPDKAEFFYRVARKGQIAKLPGTRFAMPAAVPIVQSVLGIEGSANQYDALIWDFLQGKNEFSTMAALSQEIDRVLLRLGVVRQPSGDAGSNAFIISLGEEFPDFACVEDTDWRHLIYRVGLGRLLSPAGIGVLSSVEWQSGRILDQIYVAGLLLFEAHILSNYAVAGSIAERARNFVCIANLVPAFGEEDARFFVEEFTVGVLKLELLDKGMVVAWKGRRSLLDEIIDPLACDQCFREVVPDGNSIARG